MLISAQSLPVHIPFGLLALVLFSLLPEPFHQAVLLALPFQPSLLLRIVASLRRWRRQVPWRVRGFVAEDSVENITEPILCGIEDRRENGFRRPRERELHTRIDEMLRQRQLEEIADHRERAVRAFAPITAAHSYPRVIEADPRAGNQARVHQNKPAVGI